MARIGRSLKLRFKDMQANFPEKGNDVAFYRPKA